MKVLCCGDRNWDNWLLIWRELRALGPLTEFVHGDCRGADKMCGHVAKSLGRAVQSVPADWKKYGKAAGPIRNQEMLNRHPDIGLVLAFHADLSKSRGTADMVARAEAAGIAVKVVDR
jgi:hypothetical protein